MKLTLERPILFSGPMVRAILEGRKTQTRRVAKFADNVRVCDGVPKGFLPGMPNGFEIPCPYGKPGDRLWVRESWMYVGIGSGCSCGPNGDCERTEIVKPENQKASNCWYRATFEGDAERYRWRPSIHMPRWASRLTLEIVKVRVERVQDISEEDAIAEGTQLPVAYMPKECRRAAWSERQVFQRLWDSINSKRGFGWDKKPWVWVIEFKRIVDSGTGLAAANAQLSAENKKLRLKLIDCEVE